MADLISWEIAERTAALVGGREPLSRSYHAGELRADFDELTAEAEELVKRETGLVPDAGPAQAVVIDRPGWSRANIGSFRALIAPLSDKLGQRRTIPAISAVSRTVAGVQLGTVLGWMSTRVLGQYDLLLGDEAAGEGGSVTPDAVYYVGPNILSLERRYGFPPREFRLWIALHEVTHRVQFTAVPWMREHFTSLAREAIGSFDPDPRALFSAIGRLAEDIRSGVNPLAEAGLVGVMATPAQRELLSNLQGLMGLLEGHGDVTMDRAGAALLPSAERFSAVLGERRRSASGVAKILQQLLGIESKLRQYEDGERFIHEVETAGGKSLLARVWEGPQWLPDLEELRQPPRWIERVAAG